MVFPRDDTYGEGIFTFFSLDARDILQDIEDVMMIQNCSNKTKSDQRPEFEAKRNPLSFIFGNLSAPVSPLNLSLMRLAGFII